MPRPIAVPTEPTVDKWMKTLDQMCELGEGTMTPARRNAVKTIMACALAEYGMLALENFVQHLEEKVAANVKAHTT